MATGRGFYDGTSRLYGEWLTFQDGRSRIYYGRLRFLRREFYAARLRF